MTDHQAVVADDAQSTEEKRFQTLRAKSALIGVGLYKLDSGYLMARWNLVREFRSLDEVSIVLSIMAGVRP